MRELELRTMSKNPGALRHFALQLSYSNDLSRFCQFVDMLLITASPKKYKSNHVTFSYLGSVDWICQGFSMIERF